MRYGCLQLQSAESILVTRSTSVPLFFAPGAVHNKYISNILKIPQDIRANKLGAVQHRKQATIARCLMHDKNKCNIPLEEEMFLLPALIHDKAVYDIPCRCMYNRRLI
jgi:hypothetical protein